MLFQWMSNDPQERLLAVPMSPFDEAIGARSMDEEFSSRIFHPVVH